MNSWAYFAHSQASGYIGDSADAVRTHKQSIRIAGITIDPGMITDLVGFFCRPLKYLGTRGKNRMVFYIGAGDGIFPEHYFQSVLWLSETRIYEQFKPNAGRDFNFVNGVWK